MAEGWNVVAGVGCDFHIVPVGDLRPHEGSKECWCMPTLDPEDNNVVVHHAADKREKHEVN
jgi:hypothetical protein